MDPEDSLPYIQESITASCHTLTLCLLKLQFIVIPPSSFVRLRSERIQRTEVRGRQKRHWKLDFEACTSVKMKNLCIIIKKIDWVSIMNNVGTRVPTRKSTEYSSFSASYKSRRIHFIRYLIEANDTGLRRLLTFSFVRTLFFSKKISLFWYVLTWFSNFYYNFLAFS
jgi:hypothetical protein